MKKLFVAILVSIIILASCDNHLKEYYITYKTDGLENPIRVKFYGSPKSFLIHFEEDSNIYRLAVVDTLKHKVYFFESPTKIKLIETNIIIENR